MAPGIFLTPMMSNTVPQAARDALAQTVPFPKRLGDPDEFAQFVQFAVENQYLNGEVHPVPFPATWRRLPSYHYCPTPNLICTSKVCSPPRVCLHHVDRGVPFSARNMPAHIDPIHW